MSEVHTIAGYAVVGLFAIGWLWPLGAAIARRGPGDLYWRWLTLAQVAAGLQVVIGVVLLVLGKRPTEWLHYVYGFGPIVILVIAHALARDLQHTQPRAKPIQPWVPFAFAAFICFGLTLRGLMTGLGIG
jgi:hypothetical protein